MSKNPKRKEDDQKKKLANQAIHLDDDFFDDIAHSFSHFTALVEACDWDEELANDLLARTQAAIVNIYEYCEIDNSVINDQGAMNKLLLANVSGITEIQLKIIISMLFKHLSEQHKFEKSEAGKLN